MTNEPEISLADAQQVVALKTAPRVTEQSIKDKIAGAQYIRHELGTICIITMRSGFMVTGFSACASPENYEQAVGERYSYDNAFKQLWPLEGYLLKEQLYLREAGAMHQNVTGHTQTEPGSSGP